MVRYRGPCECCHRTCSALSADMRCPQCSDGKWEARREAGQRARWLGLLRVWVVIRNWIVINVIKS